MAARRNRPGFSLKDLDPNAIPAAGGGASGAGLGAARSSLGPDMPKKPQGSFNSPFSNFSKIVYVHNVIFYHVILAHLLPQ